MTAVTALTSTAGAATTVTQWNVTGNGGFVSLDLLNALQLAGGGSEADASSTPLAEASGTGLCVDTSVTTNPCPTSATSSLSGNALHSTQDAVANGKGVTATPTGASGCTIPINTGLINVDVSCGTASASTDASGNPTASGTGSLAGVSVSLSLTSVLSGLLGGSLPAAGSLCGGASAASTSGGSNTSLDGVLTPVLGLANGLLGRLSLPGLNGTSVAGGSDVTGECSILGGLLNSLTASNGTNSLTGLVSGILDQLLGLAGGNAVGISPLTVDLGGSTTAVSTSGNVVTDSVTQHAVDLNLFGLADLQVAPTTAAVALDRSTGTVTPSCNAGVLSYSLASGVQNFLQLGSLTDLVNNILTQLSGTLNSLLAPLQTLIGELIAYNPTGNLLTCSVSSPGPTAHAAVGVLNVGLLTGLMGGVGLNVGDVSVSGSATTATPAVTTSAAKPAAPAAAAPAAAPTAVPNVTTVHTGEFWSGSLPIILLTGMGLAGAMLIGRRRRLSVARSMNPIARRRGGQ